MQGNEQETLERSGKGSSRPLKGGEEEVFNIKQQTGRGEKTEVNEPKIFNRKTNVLSV